MCLPDELSVLCWQSFVQTMSSKKQKSTSAGLKLPQSSTWISFSWAWKCKLMLNYQKNCHRNKMAATLAPHTVTAIDCEPAVSEHLCGSLRFPILQSLSWVRNDNGQTNRKQITPKLQIIISCDVKGGKKRRPILYPYFKPCLCFLVFLCILLSHSFNSLSLNHNSCGKSVPAVSTLIWL